MIILMIIIIMIIMRIIIMNITYYMSAKSLSHFTSVHLVASGPTSNHPRTVTLHNPSFPSSAHHHSQPVFHASSRFTTYAHETINFITSGPRNITYNVSANLHHYYNSATSHNQVVIPFTTNLFKREQISIVRLRGPFLS